jgi:hypothetical protein
MRTIKFRGQRFDKEFVYGYVQYFKNTDEFVIDEYTVDEDTISQFTGLYDKNGKEIYENDILKVKTNEGIGNNPLLVVYSEVYGGFCLLSKNVLNITPDKPHRPINPNWWDGFKDEIEIIGNIHDTPELLRQ